MTKDTCNAVFADPTLEVCKANAAFFGAFEGGPIYIWNTGKEGPKYWFCEHELFTCNFCPACGEGELKKFIHTNLFKRFNCR